MNTSQQKNNEGLDINNPQHRKLSNTVDAMVKAGQLIREYSTKTDQITYKINPEYVS